MKKAMALLAAAVWVWLGPGAIFCGAEEFSGRKAIIVNPEEEEAATTFRDLREGLRNFVAGPEKVNPEVRSPAEMVEVDTREPAELKAWAVDCPKGYDNGTYQGKSYCLKCPPGTRYRSQKSACVGCPAGYASDYDRPGELCFQCPAGYEAGYLQRPGGTTEANACVKCPPGYKAQWGAGRLSCVKEK
ncbi:MAG: hypothetical protein AB1641_20490 [Thermodesulfobacteriota bacterium]